MYLFISEIIIIINNIFKLLSMVNIQLFCKRFMQVTVHVNFTSFLYKLIDRL